MRPVITNASGFVKEAFRLLGLDVQLEEYKTPGGVEVAARVSVQISGNDPQRSLVEWSKQIRDQVVGSQVVVGEIRELKNKLELAEEDVKRMRGYETYYMHEYQLRHGKTL